MNPEGEYLVHIRRTKGLFNIDFREIWRYRDLLLLLVYRDFSSKYKQTILGPAWFVIQPLLTTLIFTVIFGNVAKIPTDGIPPMLFYLCGLLAWNYHAGVIQSTGNVFQTNMNLFGKVYFPRSLVPLSSTLSQLIGWSIQLLTFLLFYFYFKFFTSSGELMEASAWVWVFPLLILQTALIGVGSGFVLSSITAKYRDLQHMQNFIIQAWMYITPLVYPLSEIPESWRWVAALNPLCMVVESLKFVFFGSGTVTIPYLILSVFVSIALFCIGFVWFSKTEKNFIDSV